MKNTTVFVATRRHKTKPNKRVAIASFFSFEALSEFCKEQVSLYGVQGWISEPEFAPTSHGYRG